MTFTLALGAQIADCEKLTLTQLAGTLTNNFNRQRCKPYKDENIFQFLLYPGFLELRYYFAIM